MILPSKILTRNKIRDAKICSLYINDALTQTEIANQFGVSQTLISHILYKNRSILKPDPDYEKAQRIVWYKRALNNPRIPDANNKVDLHKEMKKEIEGDKLIENHMHVNVSLGDLIQRASNSRKIDQAIESAREEVSGQIN